MLFFLASLGSNAQKDKLLASCCDARLKEAGRCTGSAYCSACSNCSRCAHCSNGGSCGVCASYSQPVRYTAPKKASEIRSSYPSKSSAQASFNLGSCEKTKSKNASASKKVTPVYRSEDMLAVASEVLNLREGPGTEYELIEVLHKDDLIKVIAVDGEWLQVKVIQSGNYGFVNAKFVFKT